MADFASPESAQSDEAVVLRVAQANAQPDAVATLPGGSLDGLVRRDANNLLMSRDTKTVYHVDAASGAVHPINADVESPADISFDTKRQRILIPLFTKNRIEIRRLP